MLGQVKDLKIDELSGCWLLYIPNLSSCLFAQNTFQKDALDIYAFFQHISDSIPPVYIYLDRLCQGEATAIHHIILYTGDWYHMVFRPEISFSIITLSVASKLHAMEARIATSLFFIHESFDHHSALSKPENIQHNINKFHLFSVELLLVGKMGQLFHSKIIKDQNLP